MSQQIMQVECLPKRICLLTKNGIEVGFRLKRFGLLFQLGWAWRTDVPQCILGFDLPFGSVKYFNGPRMFQLGALLGFLRLRAGTDLLLFFGQRDPKVEKALEVARMRFADEVQRQIDDKLLNGDAGQEITLSPPQVVGDGAEIS